MNLKELPIRFIIICRSRYGSELMIAGMLYPVLHFSLIFLTLACTSNIDKISSIKFFRLKSMNVNENLPAAIELKSSRSLIRLSRSLQLVMEG